MRYLLKSDPLRSFQQSGARTAAINGNSADLETKGVDKDSPMGVDFKYI